MPMLSPGWISSAAASADMIRLRIPGWRTRLSLRMDSTPACSRGRPGASLVRLHVGVAKPNGLCACAHCKRCRDAVDEHRANATMVDGPLSLTLLFRFNDAGLIGSFRAEARGSMVDDRMVMAPWEGAWSNYQTCDGVQVPFTGEVAWMRPEGRRPYFVGTVTALAFEFSPRSAGLPGHRQRA
jgi:hypothetical protein